MITLEQELKDAKNQLMSAKREGDKEMIMDIEERIDDLERKFRVRKVELERLKSVLQMYEEELPIYTRANNMEKVNRIKELIEETKKMIAAAS